MLSTYRAFVLNIPNRHPRQKKRPKWMPVNYIQTIWLYIKVHGLKDERAVQIEDGTKYLNENCFKAPVSTNCGTIPR